MNDVGETIAPAPTNLPVFTQVGDELSGVIGSPASGEPSAPVSEAPADTTEQAPPAPEVSAEGSTPPERKFKPQEYDLSFKGVVEPKKPVPKNVVNNLRRWRNDPDVIDAFNQEFGDGAANQFLSLPSPQIMQNLYANKDDPDVVKEFDDAFGHTSKDIITIFDPASDKKTREEAMSKVINTLSHGDFEQTDPNTFKVDPTFVAASKFLYNVSQQSSNPQIEQLRQQAADPSDKYAQKVAADALKRYDSRQPKTDEDFANWGWMAMSMVHNNLASLSVEALKLLNASPDQRDAFAYLYNATKSANVEWSKQGVAQNIAAMAADPSNWFAIGTIGLSKIATGGVQLAGKEALEAVLKKGVEMGIHGAVNVGAIAGARSIGEQSVEMSLGELDKFSFSRLGGDTLKGAGMGLVLGGALGAGSTKLSQWLSARVEAAKKFSDAPAPFPVKPSEAPAPFPLAPVHPSEVSPKLWAKVEELDAKSAQQLARINEIETEVNKLGGVDNRAAPIVDDQIAQVEAQLEKYQGKKADSAPARKLQQRLEDLKNTPEYQRARQIDDLITEQEKLRVELSGTQGERAALGPKVNRVTQEAERLSAARQRQANEPTIQEANTMTPEQRVTALVKESTPVERQWEKQTTPPPEPQAKVPDEVLSVLNRVDDLDKMNWEQIRAAVAPVIDDWIGAISKNADDLWRFFEAHQPALDLVKLQCVMGKAVAKVEKEIAQAKEMYNIAVKMAITDAKGIDAIKATIADLTAQYEKLQAIDIPLGRYSGRLLAMRDIEDRINAALRVDSAKMRANGASPEDIAQAIVNARRGMNMNRIDNLTQRHENLVRSLAKAENAEARAKIEARIEETKALIEKEIKSLGEQGAAVAKENLSKLTGTMKQLAKDVIGVGINFMLSGLGTIKRAAYGALVHNAYMKADLLAGVMLRPIIEGMKTGQIANIPMQMSEGIKMYRVLRNGRAYGLRTGADSLMSVWAEEAVNAGKEAWHGANKSGLNMAQDAVYGIAGKNYGLTGTGEKVVDTIGKVFEFANIGLRFSDTFQANLFNKAGAGEYGALKFYERLMQATEEINAKLRDPTLTQLERDGLKAELKSLKGNNAKLFIDGKLHTEKSYVEEAVAKSFDKDGNFINQQAIDRTNYVLMRNELEGAWGKLEEWANNNWASKIMLPFLRSPVQGSMRGFEHIPGLQNVPGISNLSNEMKSADPIIAARARGKYVTGVATVLGIWKLCELGLVGKPSEWWNKEEMDARLATSYDDAGRVRLPVNVPFFGNTIDTTGADPISIPFIFVPYIYYTMKDYASRRSYDTEVKLKGLEDGYNLGPQMDDGMFNKAGDFLKAAAAGTAVAFLNNPTFSAMQDTITLLTAITKASDPNDVLKDNTTASKILTKIIRSQIGKYSPAIYKGARDEFDNKLYDTTVLDTNSVGSALADIFKAEFSWDRSDLSLRYDFMGFPIDRKYAPRSIAGPFTEKMPTSTDPRVVATRDAAYDLASYQLDSHYLTFSERVPDKFLALVGVDPRQVKAVSGDRRVLDLFAKNLRETGILDQMHHFLATPEGRKELSDRGASAGGPAYSVVTERVRNVITTARAEAWRRTLQQEGISGDGTRVEPTGNELLFMKRKEGEYRMRRDEDQRFDTFKK